MPSLDLRFAETKSLTDWISGQNLITFTRASSGTVVNAAGALETVASNLARFTHNPLTGESLGLSVEESRTNSIRNNTMAGAAAGTPGTAPTNWTLFGSTSGLTQQIIGTGTEDGINYIDVRYSGTTTGVISSGTIARYETTTQIAALSGQTWTASEYIKLASGSLANISSLQIAVIERSAAGGFLNSSVVVVTPTAASLATQRRSVTRALNNASTAFVTSQLLISAPSGASIDVTLRIGLPQLEQGASATSTISTTGAATTRSADLADLISAAIANNIRAIYVEFRSPASGTRGALSLNDNTANERSAVLTSGTDSALLVHDNGIEQANIIGGSIAADARIRVACRINQDSFAISVNGGIARTDNTGTVPTVDRLMIGRTQAGDYLNASIARIVGWVEPLPDATLQAITR